MRRRWLLAAAAALAQAAAGQPAGRPSEVVYLHGSALQGARVLSASDLAALPAEAIGEFARSRGQPGKETRTTVRGARLVRLVEPLLTAQARDDWKNLLVTVIATDGYRAQFTWVELVNTAAGAGVLLLFERDGAPLDPREGRIALMATGDARLGARHVRNALRVEVRPVAD